ncbi:hypothetical protein K438DRAFT_1831758 [Mycena galopus ATCC 62051]|nr:hypothetical protein K438DRAFT_1831758 [Mycena galopus ATCC 62051]
MSFLRRIGIFIQSLRSPTYYVGRDLQGNRYYETPSLLDDPRPRRSVKYSGSEDMWKYVGGNKRLAVQWSSWLTHTRPDPPTLEELQADILRQERVQRNVTLLNARDREEKLASSSSVAPPFPVTSHADLETPPPDPAVASPPPPKGKPLPKMPSSTQDAEPEAWTPHAAVRGTPSATLPPSHADLETPPPNPGVAPSSTSSPEPEAWTPHAAVRGTPSVTLPPSHADLETPPPNPGVSSPSTSKDTEPEAWTPHAATRGTSSAPLPPSHADLETPPPDPAVASPTIPSSTRKH